MEIGFKPNELSDLLASYNDSMLILTILIPTIAIFIIKSNRDIEIQLIEETGCSRSIIITSLLWYLVPLVFWIISNLTALNLFVDRYFIPKETAVIFLLGFGLSFIFQNLPNQKTMSTPILGTFGFSLVLLLVSTKRGAFGLDKNTNYHYSLIIEEKYPESDQPITLEGDPNYFPNTYLNKNEYLFKVDDEESKQIYERFSKRIMFFQPKMKELSKDKYLYSISFLYFVLIFADYTLNRKFMA